MIQGRRILNAGILCLATATVGVAQEPSFERRSFDPSPEHVVDAVRGPAAAGPSQFGGAFVPSRPVPRQAVSDAARFSAPTDPGIDQRLETESSAGLFRSDAMPIDSGDPAPGIVARAPIPLQRGDAGSGTENRDRRGSSSGASAGAILSALVFVVLIILGLAKLFCRKNPFAVRGVPIEAIDVLGRRSVDPRNSIYIVRVGSKMLLLGSSGTGLTTLSEITDPIEVASLANYCRAQQSFPAEPFEWFWKLIGRQTGSRDARSFEDRFTEKLFAEADANSKTPVTSITVPAPREASRVA